MAIENISDTARWVAVYRAMETERPDAHFRDPYARRLAGERGESIVRSLKSGRSHAWAMITRTAVLDEMISKIIARDGTDLVLNLAAGLDTRPYRLELPASLRWVDVDLPGILDYKREQLAAERPRCRLETVALDLTDIHARRALFARLGAEARRVLVVTEGLLVYLTAEQVAGLATDLHTPPSFGVWLAEIASPRVLKYMQRRYGKVLKQGNSPMQFAPAEGPAFFAPFGWKLAEFRSMLDESRRLNREMQLAWLWRLMAVTKKQRREWQRASGVLELQRT
jgi:methyltransferase (TIGR00027 family)